MNAIKKILGPVWLVLGGLAVYYLLINQAIPLYKKGGENLIPAAIYTFILCPMIAGALGFFGYYAMKDEFRKEN
jgi:hypothetical protein